MLHIGLAGAALCHAHCAPHIHSLLHTSVTFARAEPHACTPCRPQAKSHFCGQHRQPRGRGGRGGAVQGLCVGARARGLWGCVGSAWAHEMHGCMERIKRTSAWGSGGRMRAGTINRTVAFTGITWWLFTLADFHTPISCTPTFFSQTLATQGSMHCSVPTHPMSCTPTLPHQRWVIPTRSLALVGLLFKWGAVQPHLLLSF